MFFIRGSEITFCSGLKKKKMLSVANQEPFINDNKYNEPFSGGNGSTDSNIVSVEEGRTSSISIGKSTSLSNIW